MKNLRVPLMSLIWLMSLAAPSAAATDSEHQVWVSGTFQAKPSKTSGWLGWLDLHDRRRDGSSLFIVRPAIGYQVTDRLALYAGYAWIGTIPDAGSNRHEHRAWQQAMLNVPMPIGWALSLRPRLEQRFAEGGDEVGHRVRLLARGAVSPWEGFPLLFVVWDEAFVQFNDTDWGAKQGFDQNRLFVGVGAPALPGSRVEVGYLQVYLDRAPNNEIDHNLAVNLFYSY